MDIETYKAQIRAIDEQIDTTKREIRRIESQIEEAQNARISANTMRNNFDDFVAKHQKSVGRPVKGKHLRSFKSFWNKAQSFLRGSDYSKASGFIEEISCEIGKKLKIHEENLDYCKTELRKLNKKKEQLVEEYNLAVLTYTSGGETV